MYNKILKTTFWVCATFFIFSIVLMVSGYVVESFTYSGFIAKHFKLNINYAIYVSVISGVLVNVINLKIRIEKISEVVIKKIFLLNSILFVLSVIFWTAVNLIEFGHYSNFIYSKIHFRPELFNHVVYALLVPVIVTIVLLFKSTGSKIKNDKLVFFRLKKISSKLPNISLWHIKQGLLIIYTMVFTGYVLTSSALFINKFYQVDTQLKQQNELKYFTQKIDIYGWISEYLPETKDVIFWCDQQKGPVNLVTFDPNMIWMTYEGLSRVFLTNCRYANIDPVSKSYDYFKADQLLLVSVSKCDTQMIDTNPDPTKNVVEYFKIVNNRYICDSQEIIPNLYMWRRNK